MIAKLSDSFDTFDPDNIVLMSNDKHFVQSMVAAIDHDISKMSNNDPNLDDMIERWLKYTAHLETL